MLNLARMYLFHHRRRPGASTPLFANVGTRTSRRYYCSVETRILAVAHISPHLSVAGKWRIQLLSSPVAPSLTGCFERCHHLSAYLLGKSVRNGAEEVRRRISLLVRCRRISITSPASLQAYHQPPYYYRETMVPCGIAPPNLTVQ